MLDSKMVGAIAGVAIGFAFVAFGALNAFFVALFILAGWLVGKFWLGELDFLAYYEAFMLTRGRKRMR